MLSLDTDDLRKVGLVVDGLADLARPVDRADRPAAGSDEVSIALDRRTTDIFESLRLADLSLERALRLLGDGLLSHADALGGADQAATDALRTFLSDLVPVGV